MTPMISEWISVTPHVEGCCQPVDFANVFIAPQWNNLLYNSR